MTTLNDTLDARLWAEEFCRIFNGHQITDFPGEQESYVTEATMVAWFANAIETGRNAGRKETCPHVEEDVFDLHDSTKCCRRCGMLLNA